MGLTVGITHGVNAQHGTLLNYVNSDALPPEPIYLATEEGYLISAQESKYNLIIQEDIV